MSLGRPTPGLLRHTHCCTHASLKTAPPRCVHGGGHMHMQHRAGDGALGGATGAGGAFGLLACVAAAKTGRDAKEVHKEVLERIKVEAMQELNPLTILHKKELIVGGRKIESKVWKSICEVFSRIWDMDSFRIYI